MRKKPTPEFLKAIERSMRPGVKRLEKWVRGEKKPLQQAAKTFAPHRDSLIPAPDVSGHTDLADNAPAPAPAAAADAAITLRAQETLLMSFRGTEALQFAWPTLLGFAAMQNQTFESLVSFNQPVPTGWECSGSIGPALRQDGPALVDVAFSDQNTLRLFLDVEKTLTGAKGVRFFQSITTPTQAQPSLKTVGESGLATSGIVHIEATLFNPLLPVLVTLLDGDGYTISTGLIAFPSLARGGLHYGEARASAPQPDPAQAFLSYDHARFQERLRAQPAIDTYVVNPEGGLRSEPIFSEILAEWLQTVFQKTVHIAPLEQETGTVLYLPYDAIPTIAALTARALPKTAGHPAYVICNRDDHLPYSVVTLPKDQTDLAGLQPKDSPDLLTLSTPAGAPAGDIQTSPAILGLRFFDMSQTHEASLIFPHAPDNKEDIFPQLQSEPQIICQISVSRQSATLDLLATLARQSCAKRMLLLVAPAGNGLCETLEPVLDSFPGGWKMLPAGADIFDATSQPAADLLAGYAEDTVVMQLSEDCLLHDPRVVDCLGKLACAEGVAMAGCVEMAELPSRRGAVLSVENSGYFPTHVSLVGAPTLVFSEVDTIRALPNCTYPVVAPPEDAFALQLKTLREVQTTLPQLHCQGQPALALGLALTATGRRCVCTSAVSTLRVGPPFYREAMDPLTLAQWPVSNWQEILSQVTLVRRVS